MSPSVAVLTGAEFPFTPPTMRGGGMKNTYWCCVINPASGGWSKFWFWSNVGRILCNSLCASLGMSHKRNSRVMRWMSLVGSGLGGHSAPAACACLASICSNSACLVFLRVPTPGVTFWVADGVSWSTCAMILSREVEKLLGIRTGQSTHLSTCDTRGDADPCRPTELFLFNTHFSCWRKRCRIHWVIGVTQRWAGWIQ